MIAVLHVNGTPRPKQSARWVNGRAVSVTAARQHLKVWNAAIVAAGRNWLLSGGEPFGGAVRVDIDLFFFSKDARRHGEPHTSRPDKDNCEKAILDALQAGGVLLNDAAAASGSTVKRWGPKAGAVITVRPFGAAAPTDDDPDDLGAAPAG